MNKNIVNLIIKIKKNIKYIEKNNFKQTFKTNYFKKISQLYKKYLKKQNISIFTYSKYITLIRKQFIKKKHHNLNKNINLLSKKFKYYKKEINKLKYKPINKIFKKIKKINKKLSKINILIKYLNKIKLTNNNNIYKIKNIIKKIPEWKKELKILIIYKWYKANNIIFNKIKQGIKLFKKIKKLKINHEILFHLKIEKKILFLIKKKSIKSLKIKKNNTVKINYKKYINKIYNILNNKYKLKSFNDISALCYSLSAISGRRMIEIIYRGKFKIYNKYKLYFKGQVKNNKNKKYKIYTLLNTKIFIKNIKKLRSCKIIKNIFKKINKKKNILISKNAQISNYLSIYLNKWVKKFFNDKKRTFKDSRSIYARITFKKWFNNDKKWKFKDEDIFFSKILGHRNINSQMYYKQFKLYNFSNKWKPKKNKNILIKKLKLLDNKLNKIIKRKTSYRIHYITKKILKKNPNKKITSYILRKYGFNTKLIQRYIKFISKYIK